MSNALELVVSTIQRFLLGASPSDADSLPGSNSHLFLLIFSQLQRTHSLLEDFSKELLLDWHGLMYEELYRVVTRITTLVRYPGDISIPAEAKGEHLLETLLDVRWWTWVIALQVGTLLTDPTVYNVYFGTFEGVLEVKVSSLPFGEDSVLRRLPSYSFELWQQGTEGRLREILQSKSGGNRLRDQGQNEADMLLTDVRNAELPEFKIKQLGTTKFRDAGKPSSIGDYLPIDLTQDLLGASTTGYVIRTTFSNGQGELFSCALKRINTMDDNPPDLARLWHPHVVHLLHHWREKSGLHCKDRERVPSSPFMTFLVMELMDGDLAKLMTRTKKAGVSPFSLLVAVDLMLQIAKGMLYLHEMGVSHPHLKCDNVLCRAENKTRPAFQVGDVRVKLGGFGCSRMANVDTKNRDVFCFGLTCLEILTGDDWSEDIHGADRVPKPIIPEMTPTILKHCISSCLSINLTFSEIVMLLLLAQCQIMQTCNDEMMLCAESSHTIKAETNIPDLASSSTSRGGLNEVFHVHQLHPQLGEVSTSVPITLIFFHGFPKVSEEWRITWMTRDNKLVWPQKWLPEDLGGNIHVLSVSFDDRLNVSSNQTIENLLQILILSPKWKLGGIEQAIILVGHSFGGVIIKSLVTEAQKMARKTVVNSVDFEEVMKCKKFVNRLASIVFYSVPHALTNTEFENYISGSSNTRVLQRSSLLKSLREDDYFIPKMIQLSRDFESAVPHKTKVLVFLEGKPMGKKCFLVSENSREGQSLSWEWHKVDKDNHFEVCRPDSKSHAGYKILLSHLLKMCMITYDCTSPTINVRRQSWRVIGTVFIAICKFKKLLDKRSTSFSTKSDIHSTRWERSQRDVHATGWEIEEYPSLWSIPSSAWNASVHSTRFEIEDFSSQWSTPSSAWHTSVHSTRSEIEEYPSRWSTPSSDWNASDARAFNFAFYAAENVVMQWEKPSFGHSRQMLIFEGSPNDAVQYLHAFDEIANQLKSMRARNWNSTTQRRIHNLHQIALRRLLFEFEYMLRNFGEPVDPDWLLDSLPPRSSILPGKYVVDPESGSSDGDNDEDEDIPVAQPVDSIEIVLDLVPPQVVVCLARIAKRLVFDKAECMDFYVASRKIILEKNLHELGMESVTIDEVQKSKWEVQVPRIKKWNQAMNVGVMVLFPSEKQLCDEVFSPPLSENIFNDIGKGAMMQLLSFGEAIAIIRRSPEKLFMVLDMYETLRDVLPELDVLFAGACGASVRSEAEGILMRLGEAARGTFAEFEITIQRAASRKPVRGGAVDAFNRYVMNYIILLCDYTDTLKQLVGKKKEVPKLFAELPEYGDNDRGDRQELSPFTVQINSFMDVLQNNLETKSKIYMDPALRSLFLMNNVSYMIRKVKDSQVRALVGDDWVKKYTRMLFRHARNYLRVAWSQILAFLRDEGIQNLKDRLKNFNAAFDETHRIQSQWVVYGDELRDELRISIAEKLIPAYRGLVGRYGRFIETGRHPEKYIKYQWEELESAIDDLFSGPK